MSAKPDTEAEGADPASTKRKKIRLNKKMLLIVLGLAVLAAAAGGGWLYLSRQQAQDGEEEDVAVEEVKAVPKHPPTYLPLDVMVVNLADPGGERVAQVGVTLELSDAKAPEKVKPYIPAIRSGALMLASQKTAGELLSREGKEQLAKEILAEATSHFGAAAGKGPKSEEQPENPVRRVLFVNFIVQ